jgi:hypothetical protein
MSLGKWFVVFGLAANIVGTFCLGYVLPREATTSYGSAVPHPFTARGRFAARFGWWLLGLGFALQGVGTVLWA